MLAGTRLTTIADSSMWWVTTLLAWVYIAGGVLLLVAAPFQDAKLAAFALLGGWAILGGLAVRWGHAAISTRPLAGFGGVLFGAVPLGLVLSASVLAPVFAVVVGFVEGRRAWMLRRAMKREGPYYSRYW